MRQDLAQRIEAGCVVVTPNRRLAGRLKREFDLAQLAAGKAAWPAADCLPINAFLERLHGELTRFRAGATRLAPQQEAALWEQVIAATPQGEALLKPAAAARAARDAWQLQHAYRIDLAKHRSALDDDGRAYADWAGRFAKICRDRDWLDSARLPDAIVAALERGDAPTPRPLVAYAFLEPDPQQRALLYALATRGWEVTELAPQARAGRGLRTQYEDGEAELISIAARVRAVLAENPAARIGIVVPDLAGRRADVVRIFDDVLEASRAVSASRERPRPYNVSLGLPLASYPLAHSAFLVLALARNELPLEEAGSLLRSPFIAGAERELASRALLDAVLRDRRQVTTTLEALRSAARGDGVSDPAASPALAERLERWIPLARDAVRRKQLPSQWSATFLQLLSGLGWPGERTLDSEEFQTFEKWREAVSGLSALDLVTGRMSFDEALAALRRVCGDTPFQPESPEVPVQVLGVLEANGLEFDRLFVAGLTDENWPEPPRPNPFLPIALQRAANVPHASADRNLEFARRAMAQWLGAAAVVNFSHALREGDRELNASPLLRGLPEDKPDASGTALYQQAVFAARAIEPLADFTAPPLPAGIEAPRGAEFFKNQAACPFRSFAAHRLGAGPLEAGCVGLDPRDRGELVHRAAQNVWDELGNHARLVAASDEELKADVGRAVAGAVERMRRKRPDVMTRGFAALERERLAGLLLRLLVLEKQRAPFELLAREGPQVVTVAGVKVRTRPDRVDRLADGALVVLDYKTGRANAGDWTGERPDEPQLPLYAVSTQGEVAGVAFVQVRADDVSFKGLIRAEGVLPTAERADGWRGVRRHGEWSGLFEGWRTVLENLAREYLAGRADVEPKSYPETCRHCAFGMLCRVRELKVRGPAAEEDDGGE